MYVWLFYINFYISAFTFGGGYIAITMIQRFFVEEKQYFSEEQLMEMAAVAQSSPGAIAVNLSMLAGYECAGIKGALLSILGALLPPFLIMGALSYFYTTIHTSLLLTSILIMMQAGVAAIFLDMLLGLLQNVGDGRLQKLLLLFTFVGSCCFSISVSFLLLTAVMICIINYGRKQR